MRASPRWQFWIDTGGTFTDCLVRSPGGTLRRLKVLSTGALRGEISAVEPDGALRIRGLPECPINFFVSYRLRVLDAG